MAAKKKTKASTTDDAAEKPTKKRRRAVKKSGRGPEWTFPKNTLEDTIRVARAIEDKNAGKPMRADMLVRAVGYHQVSDWRFRDLLKAANMYGLTDGTPSSTVSLRPVGQDIVAPSTAAQRQKALLEAFRSVEVFKNVEQHYSGKKIPDDEYFENALTRDFGIPRDRLATFIQIFTDNLKFLNLFDARRVQTATTDGTPDQVTDTAPVESAAPASASSSRVREFLDTCFVMMPFGEWFDRYYQEIYAPAIKEAGFEPVRADELFTTGSVVEQVWEQVQKSRVLLADLTDRNANVFYELGLAHAAIKPVVLTAARLDDVPFDLRHLRVIVYDTREPSWDAKLRKHIAEHLKSAKAEPNKSIPQPFRELLPPEEPRDSESV